MLKKLSPGNRGVEKYSASSESFLKYFCVCGISMKVIGDDLYIQYDTAIRSAIRPACSSAIRIDGGDIN